VNAGVSDSVIDSVVVSVGVRNSFVGAVVDSMVVSVTDSALGWM
jgi:hypothetical protein